MSNEDKIMDMCAITGCDPDIAKLFLEANAWSNQLAIGMYFERYVCKFTCS